MSPQSLRSTGCIKHHQIRDNATDADAERQSPCKTFCVNPGVIWRSYTVKPPAWGSSWVLHQPGKSQLERSQKILVKTPVRPLSLLPTAMNSELTNISDRAHFCSVTNHSMKKFQSKKDPTTTTHTPQHLRMP